MPPETEYDSNTHSRQLTQSRIRPHQGGMLASPYLMHWLYATALQLLRGQTIGLMLPTHECLLTVDECQDLAGNYEEYCVIKQKLQGAGSGSRHRLSAFARGAATFVVR